MKKLLSVLVATVFIGSVLPILSTQAGWDDRWSDVELMAAPNNFIRIPKRKTEIPQQRGYGVLYVDEDSSGMRLYFEDDAGDIVDLSEHSIPPDSVRLNNIGDPDGQTHFDLGDYRVVFETTGGDGPQFIIRSAFTGMEGGVLLRVNEGHIVPQSFVPRLADFNAVDRDVSGIRISNSHDSDELPPELFLWPHSLLELTYPNSEHPGFGTSYIRCERQGGEIDFRVGGDGSVELSNDLRMREIPPPGGHPVADTGWLYLQDNGSGVSNLYFEDENGLVHDLVSHDVPPGAILWNELGNPTASKTINFGTYRTVFNFGDTGGVPRLTLQTSEDLHGFSLLYLRQIGSTAVTVDSYLAYLEAEDPTARGIYVGNAASTGFVAGHSLLRLHYTIAATSANTDFLLCSDIAGEVFKITRQGDVTINGVLDLNSYFLTEPNTIASQSTLDLGDLTGTPGNFYTVTGTFPISNISAAQSINGRIIVLKFTGVTSVFTKSAGTGNFRLAGDFLTGPTDTLTLICDGTNWCEISRSVNTD